MKLYERANEIWQAEENAEKAEQERKRQELAENEAKLLKEFEETFADYLPMIKEAGINYQPMHLNNLGKYIQFYKDDPNLNYRIRFESAKSYLFFDSPRGFGQHGTLGEWDKDGLVLFLAKAFPLKEQDAPVLEFPISNIF